MDYPQKIVNILKDERISARNLATLNRYNDDIIIERKSLSRRYLLLYVGSKIAIEINKDFDKMTKDDVKRFVASLSHLKDSTVNTYTMNLKQVFRYLADSDDFPETVKFLKPGGGSKNRKLPEDLLTIEEIKKMIESADNPRDRCLISVLYESGCRIGEIVGLNIKNVVFDRYGSVIMVRGKTGMRRVRLINSSPYLTVWINEHPGDRNSPLFVAFTPNKYGGRLLAESANIIIQKIAKRASIEKHVHCHLMRHSRLTECAKFMTEQELKVFAGWTGDSEMAGIYVHLSGHDIDKKILENAGILDEEDKDPGDKILKPQKCPRCTETNPATAKFCYKCGAALTIETAMEDDADLEKRIQHILENVSAKELLMK